MVAAVPLDLVPPATPGIRLRRGVPSYGDRAPAGARAERAGGSAAEGEGEGRGWNLLLFSFFTAFHVRVASLEMLDECWKSWFVVKSRSIKNREVDEE